MEKSFSIRTLGCKVNQYNSQIVRENLLKAGFKEEGKGYYQIVNGCVVTQKAVRKTRKEINKARKTGQKVLATGCYARGDYSDNGAIYLPEEKDIFRYITGEDSLYPVISSFASHSRAFVKIQQGCNSLCSYCIVPFRRGDVFSRPEEEILEEVETLSSKYAELVITGTHLGLYGKERGQNLSSLLEKILQKATFSRVRLSSIEINEIDSELLSWFSHPRLCPHLHIPLQSGSNKILKLMRRPYTREFFLDKCEQIKKAIPEIGLTADVMVGFPQEEEEDFSETLNLVEKIGFHRIHIFPFSAREGTQATKIYPRVAEDAKREREKTLQRLSLSLSYLYRRSLLGKRREVLIEQHREGSEAVGYSEDYVLVKINPTHGIILDSTKTKEESRIYPVEISKVTKNSTEGRIAKEWLS